MAQNPNEEQYSLVIKIILYMAGVTLGLGAKLALINKENSLTWKEVIYHSCVAFACAWCMWYAFKAIGKPEMATWAAVICGRFGDNVLLMMWGLFKKLVRQFDDDIQKQ